MYEERGDDVSLVGFVVTTVVILVVFWLWNEWNKR